MKRSLSAIGDQGVLVHLPDEASAGRFANAVRGAGFAWLLDVVPAYASVGVFFDPGQTRLAPVLDALRDLPIRSADGQTDSRVHIVPCCYESESDLARVAFHVRMTPEEVIALHADRDYTVYAIGFAPGFPYLGYLPPELQGVPRLDSPRLRVEPGSVGLTGRQTGIYPMVRPGGWNLIGRTPLTLVDVETGYFPLRVGDRVRFRRIDRTEFARLAGGRLDTAWT